MIQILFGMAIGVYITQNYDIPDFKLYIKTMQKTLEAYEKDPSKKQK